MWITRALLVVFVAAAVLSHMVVATTVQKVTAKTCFTTGCVAHWHVVIVTFAIDEILADSWRVVTTADTAMIQHYPIISIPSQFKSLSCHRGIACCCKLVELAFEKACNKTMTLKLTESHPQWCYLTGYVVHPVSNLCFFSNGIVILYPLQDVTSFYCTT